MGHATNTTKGGRKPAGLERGRIIKRCQEKTGKDSGGDPTIKEWGAEKDGSSRLKPGHGTS